METKPKIFVDTCVVKCAADTRLEFIPKEQKLNWGGIEQTVLIHNPVLVNDNWKQFFRDNNKTRLWDSICTRFMAAFEKKGIIELCWHTETIWEHAGLKRTLNLNGKFHGAELKHVGNPFPYSRIIVGGNEINRIDHQFEFYKSIKNNRYNELKRVTNVHAQVKENRIKNQMADAFHILCAEKSECDHFVTIDYNLEKSVRKSTVKTLVNITTPSKLIKQLITKRPWLAWWVIIEAIKIIISKRTIYTYRQKFNIFTGKPNK